MTEGALTPSQQRVREGLLAWTEPRPPVDPALAARLREQLSEATAEAAEALPDGAELFLSKSKLDALSCDGRFVDFLEGEFTWSAPIVKGQLAHHGIEIDFAGGRQRDPAEVIDVAWERLVTSGSSAATFLESLDGAEADALRGQARGLLTGFREQFPALPDKKVHPEDALRVRLHGGRLILSGRPDLRLGGPTSDVRRMLLLDLKTGGRHSLRHLADMRFYALLATLKHDVAPFRVATYYLDEADWDHEDVDEDVLEAAVRDIAAKAPRAVALEHDRPPEEEWRLLAAPHCRWCGRLPICPAAAEAGYAPA